MTAPRIPRISIITSSYNQGQFIGRTIESVLAQNYPALEHIIVDGLSTDDTPSVLARYPHLKVIRERDRGQADAINKGFRSATGEILSFLNSDDTFEPGALHRVAEALDAAQGRHVVMGRCRFIDEHDRFLGVEHPSAFESHRRVLEIWKGHCLPQPAIFWSREAWDRCGPMNIDEQLMLDYDLFCRMSRRYQFHWIDHVVANYRIHTQSKTSSVTDAQRLDQAIEVSRRYWGSPLTPMFWQIQCSHATFRFNRRARASRWLRTGQAQWRQRQWLKGGARLAVGLLLAPDVVANVAVAPMLRPVLERFRGATRIGRPHPQTDAWLSRTALHADGWAGPVVEVTVAGHNDDRLLVLAGAALEGRLAKPLEIEALLDGRSLGRCRVERSQEKGFRVSWPISHLEDGPHTVRLIANGYVVPNDAMGNGDFRPLSYVLQSLSTGKGA